MLLWKDLPLERLIGILNLQGEKVYKGEIIIIISILGWYNLLEFYLLVNQQTAKYIDHFKASHIHSKYTQVKLFSSYNSFQIQRDFFCLSITIAIYCSWSCHSKIQTGICFHLNPGSVNQQTVAYYQFFSLPLTV